MFLRLLEEIRPEQRYQAVLAVVGDGETVTDVAARFGFAVIRR